MTETTPFVLNKTVNKLSKTVNKLNKTIKRSRNDVFHILIGTDKEFTCITKTEYSRICKAIIKDEKEK